MAIERDAHSLRLVGDTEKDWEEDGEVMRLGGFRDALRGWFEDGLGRGVVWGLAGGRDALRVCFEADSESGVGGVPAPLGGVPSSVDWVQFLVLTY